MGRYVFTLAATAFAVVLALAAVASAGTGATKKQIAITIKPATETFQLSISAGGAILRDSGEVTWATSGQGFVAREGQRVRVWTGTGRFSGKRGELVLRFRWEWLDAGRGYEAGLGAWRVVEGTGSYAALRGNGRSAAVWLPRGPAASRVDGFVRDG